MQCFLGISCAVMLLFAACGQSSAERKLVGEWLSGCSIDITTLKADGSF
jgi:hypothetical protein